MFNRRYLALLSMFATSCFSSPELPSSESNRGLEVGAESSDKGVNGSEGTGFVDPLTGDAVYAYPFTLPPGRDGFTPKLNLTYNSSRGNSDVGRGFQLGFGAAISLDTSKGVPRYDGTDTYVFEGRPLVLMSGSVSHAAGPAQEYRLINNSSDLQFLRVQPSVGEAFWQTRDRNGVVRTFTESVRTTVGGRAVTFRWDLTKEQDATGNIIEYRYSVAEGPSGALVGRVPRLAEILYGAKESVALPVGSQDSSPNQGLHGQLVQSPTLGHLFRVTVGRYLHPEPAPLVPYKPAGGGWSLCQKGPRPDYRSGGLLYPDGEDESIWGVGVESVVGTTTQRNDGASTRSRASSLIHYYRLTYNWNEVNASDAVCPVDALHAALRKVEHFGIDETGAVAPAAPIEFHYYPWEREFSRRTRVPVPTRSVKPVEADLGTSPRISFNRHPGTWFGPEVSSGLGLGIGNFGPNRYQIDPHLQYMDRQLTPWVHDGAAADREPFLEHTLVEGYQYGRRVLGGGEFEDGTVERSNPSLYRDGTTRESDVYWPVAEGFEQELRDIDGDSLPDLVDWGGKAGCYQGNTGLGLWRPLRDTTFANAFGLPTFVAGANGLGFDAEAQLTFQSKYDFLDGVRRCTSELTVQPKSWQSYLSKNYAEDATATANQHDTFNRPYYPEQPNSLRWIFNTDLDGDGYSDIVRLFLDALPVDVNTGLGAWYWSRNTTGETGTPSYGPWKLLQQGMPFPWEHRDFWPRESRPVTYCLNEGRGGLDGALGRRAEECLSEAPEGWRLFAEAVKNGRNVLAGARSASTSMVVKNYPGITGTPWYETRTLQEASLGELLDVTGDGLPDRVATAIAAGRPSMVVYPQERTSAGDVSFGSGRLWYKCEPAAGNATGCAGVGLPKPDGSGFQPLAAFPRVSQSLTRALNQNWNAGRTSSDATYAYPSRGWTETRVLDTAIDLNADGLVDFVSTPQLPVRKDLTARVSSSVISDCLTRSTAPERDACIEDVLYREPDARSTWNGSDRGFWGPTRFVNDDVRTAASAQPSQWERAQLWWVNNGRGVASGRLYMRGKPARSLGWTVTVQKDNGLAGVPTSRRKYAETLSVDLLADYNGDGLSDLITVPINTETGEAVGGGESFIRYGTGNGFANATVFVPRGLATLSGWTVPFSNLTRSSYNSEVTAAVRQITDMTGDGRPDVAVYVPPSRAGESAQLEVYSDSDTQAAPGRMRAIVAAGVTTNFLYATAASKGLKMPTPKWLVDTVRQVDSGDYGYPRALVEPGQRTRFVYGTPTYAASIDGAGVEIDARKEFRGFEWFGVCSPLGTQMETRRDLSTVDGRVGDGPTSEQYVYGTAGVPCGATQEKNEQCQALALRTCSLLTPSRQQQNRLRSIVVTSNQAPPLPGARRRGSSGVMSLTVMPIARTATEIDPVSGLRRHLQTQYEYAEPVAHRITLQRERSSEVDDRGFVLGEERVTLHDYLLNPVSSRSTYRMVETDTQVLSGHGELLSHVQQAYDYGLGLTAGLKTKDIVYDDITDRVEGEALVTHYLRDNMGHTIETTSPGGLVSRSCYDGLGMYAVSRQDPRGLRTEQVVDLGTGQVLESTGPVNLDPAEYACSTMSTPQSPGRGSDGRVTFVLGARLPIPASATLVVLPNTTQLKGPRADCVPQVRDGVMWRDCPTADQELIEPPVPTPVFGRAADGGDQWWIGGMTRLFYPSSYSAATPGEINDYASVSRRPADMAFRRATQQAYQVYPPLFAAPMGNAVVGTEWNAWGQGYENVASTVSLEGSGESYTMAARVLASRSGSTAAARPGSRSAPVLDEHLLRASSSPVQRTRFDGLGRISRTFASYERTGSGEYTVAETSLVTYDPTGRIITTIAGQAKQPRLSLATSRIARITQDGWGRTKKSETAVQREPRNITGGVDRYVTEWAELSNYFDGNQLLQAESGTLPDGPVTGQTPEAFDGTGYGVIRRVVERDDLLRVVRTRDALGNETSVRRGLVVVDGRVYEFIDSRDPAGARTLQYLDIWENVVLSKRFPTGADDSSALVTRMAVDSLGRITRADDPDGSIRIFSYDLVGRLHRQSRYGGVMDLEAARPLREIEHLYDADSREIATVVRAGSEVRTHQHIYSGAYLDQEVPEGAVGSGLANYSGTVYEYNKTDFTQDSFGLSTTQTHATEKVSQRYGPQGVVAENRKVQVLLDEHVLSYSYSYSVDEQDLLGAVLQSSLKVDADGYNEGYALRMEYDLRGQLSKVYNGEGVELESRSYNTAGKLKRVQNSMGVVEAYYYSALGQLVRHSVQTRLTDTAASHGWIQEAAFYPNGLPYLYHTWDVGASGRVGPDIYKYAGFDLAGRTAWTWANWTLPDGRADTYYEAQTHEPGKLRIYETYEDTPSADPTYVRYQYAGTDPSQPTALQIATDRSDYVRLSYDVQGARSSKNGADQQTDPLERLREHKHALYVYGASGERTHVYNRDDGRVQAKLGALHCEFEAAGRGFSVDSCFVRAGTQRIELGTGRTFSLHRDQQGSPAVIVHPDLSFQRVEFGTYGTELFNSVGGELPWGEAFQNGWKDPTGTGLVRYGARDYDPMTRTWTSVDPVFENQPYEFNNNNPWVFADATGLQGEPIEPVPVPPPIRAPMQRGVGETGMPLELCDAAAIVQGMCVAGIGAAVLAYSGGSAAPVVSPMLKGAFVMMGVAGAGAIPSHQDEGVYETMAFASGGLFGHFAGRRFTGRGLWRSAPAVESAAPPVEPAQTGGVCGTHPFTCSVSTEPPQADFVFVNGQRVASTGRIGTRYTGGSETDNGFVDGLPGIEGGGPGHRDLVRHAIPDIRNTGMGESGLRGTSATIGQGGPADFVEPGQYVYELSPDLPGWDVNQLLSGRVSNGIRGMGDNVFCGEHEVAINRRVEARDIVARYLITESASGRRIVGPRELNPNYRPRQIPSTCRAGGGISGVPASGRLGNAGPICGVTASCRSF